MRKILGLLISALVIGVMFVGCGPAAPSVVDSQTTRSEYDISIAITNGNHSWIPINISGKTSENAILILDILRSFETAHPEFEIVDWKIDSRPSDYSGARIYGIWVDHRPR